MRGNQQQIFVNDALGDPDVLGVGAVVEEKIVAQVFLAVQAIETCAARSRVSRHHARTLSEVPYPRANFNHFAGNLMSKERGRLNHVSVVAAPVNLQIGG